jgi:hypothetical protein
MLLTLMAVEGMSRACRGHVNWLRNRLAIIKAILSRMRACTDNFLDSDAPPDNTHPRYNFKSRKFN